MKNQKVMHMLNWRMLYIYIINFFKESLEKALDVFTNKPLIDGRKVFAERADSLGVIKRK